MSRHDMHDVLVIGGGVAGAALALALVRDGLDVALVEPRAPRPWSGDDDVDPRVVALAPDAAALLDDLGVWQSIHAARVGPYQRMHVWDALAPGELTFDARDRGQAALGWITENRLIQHMLWQALRGSDARLLTDVKLTGIEDGENAVQATLDDGTRLRARLLVGADGAASPVRELLGIDWRGRDYGQRGVVSHVATTRPHENTAWQRFLPSGPLAFLPLADGRCSVVWSLPDAQAEAVLALDDDAFCTQLGAALDFRLGTITSATPRFAFPLRLRLSKRLVQGRCLLLGDAARSVHPLAGQGMNLGLRDVACLRQVIASARQRDRDIAAADVLRRYERERRSEGTLAARGMDGIERLFGNDLMPLANLRGLGLAAVNRITPLRNRLADLAAGRR